MVGWLFICCEVTGIHTKKNHLVHVKGILIYAMTVTVEGNEAFALPLQVSHTKMN